MLAQEIENKKPPCDTSQVAGIDDALKMCFITGDQTRNEQVTLPTFPSWVPAPATLFPSYREGGG